MDALVRGAEAPDGSLDPPVRAAETQFRPSDLEERVVAASLCCLGRWGLAKTTLDDVARQAGCSRATVYRLFPGGKEALVAAVARSEVARVGAAVVQRFEEADSLEDALTAGLAESARQLLGHPALPFLLVHEPQSVVPWLAFRRGEELLAFVSTLAAPYLVRWLAPGQARRAGEWAARVLLSFCVCPKPGFDLTDDTAARSFVATFMLPGLVPDR